MAIVIATVTLSVVVKTLGAPAEFVKQVASVLLW